MSDHLNDILLVGTGYMGCEHCRVLSAQGASIIAVGRSVEGCDSFQEKTGVKAVSGGIESYVDNADSIPETAIVAVNIDSLADTAELLLNCGVKRILIEKPGGMNRDEIQRVAELSKEKNASTFLAYNRRFYAATLHAIKMIKEDGGVSSFCFEFSEWSDSIATLKHSDEVKDIWLLANSSHVIDLAFFLGGYPKEMCSYVMGRLPWHKNGSTYAGAGVSENGALFSYQANWDAPGRWGVEILTSKRRLIFRPMEKLQVQKRNSVSVELYDMDDSIDIDYKPGLFMQAKCFVNNEPDSINLLDIHTYLDHFDIYERISGKVK